MKYFFVGLLLFILAIFQSVFSAYFFAVMFCVGLFASNKKTLAAYSFLVSGLFLDLLGTSTFGKFTLIFAVINFVLYILVVFVGANLFSTVLLIFTANFLFNLLAAFSHVVFPNVFFNNLLVSFVLFWLLYPLVKFTTTIFYKYGIARRN